MDSLVPLTHHDSRDLGLICLIKKHKTHFGILSDLRIQSWIFLKKRANICRHEIAIKIQVLQQLTFQGQAD